MRIRRLIEHAYQLRPAQLVGGPEWLDSERYDIDAQVDGTPSVERR
jgi:uncharacterized protein (TIGR03435 family)